VRSLAELSCRVNIIFELSEVPLIVLVARSLRIQLALQARYSLVGRRCVNARESIRVTGGNIDWIYPGRNELTSYTID